MDEDRIYQDYMYNIDWDLLDEYLDKAEQGDAFSMFILARGYGAGIYSDTSDEKYLYWLKKFLNTKDVKRIIQDLEDRDSDSDEMKATEVIDESAPFDIYDEYLLRDMIIEAGVELGLYYRGSGDLEELVIAQEALSDAYTVSRYGEVEYGDEYINILETLSEIYETISSKNGGAG